MTHEISMAGVSVFLAMPAHRDLPVQTVASLLATQGELHRRNIPYQIEVVHGGSLVHHARSKLAHLFLQSKCTHLFWVDSDMAWQPEDFLRLLAIGTHLSCVGAIYTTKTDIPTFQLNVETAHVRSNEFQCIPVSGFGLGFTCVQRPLMEALAHKAPRRRFPGITDPIPHIFRCDDAPGADGVMEPRGEDIAFFADVRSLGHDVWLDPNITLGHVGPKVYSASFLEFMTMETSNELACQSPAE